MADNRWWLYIKFKGIICTICICCMMLCDCSDEKMMPSIGVLTIQNQNDFDIKIHLLANKIGEEVLEIGVDGIEVQYQLDKEIEYTLGIYTDVEDGTEIKVMVCDGKCQNNFKVDKEEKVNG